MAEPTKTTVDESPKPRCILFPVDGSTHSDRAFEWYAKNMHRANDSVVFIHVIEPVYTSPAIGMAMESPPLPDMARVLEESVNTGKRLCQQCMSMAKSKVITSHAFLHVDNKPGNALVKAIKDHKADMIIMGNRGLSTLRRTFLGSVSDHVLHHAHIPVVIVPPKA